MCANRPVSHHALGDVKRDTGQGHDNFYNVYFLRTAIWQLLSQ